MGDLSLGSVLSLACSVKASWPCVPQGGCLRDVFWASALALLLPYGARQGFVDNLYLSTGNKNSGTEMLITFRINLEHSIKHIA